MTFYYNHMDNADFGQHCDSRFIPRPFPAPAVTRGRSLVAGCVAWTSCREKLLASSVVCVCDWDRMGWNARRDTVCRDELSGMSGRVPGFLCLPASELTCLVRLETSSCSGRGADVNWVSQYSSWSSEQQLKSDGAACHFLRIRSLGTVSFVSAAEFPCMRTSLSQPLVGEAGPQEQ